MPSSILTGQLRFDYHWSQWLIVLWLAIVVTLGTHAIILALLRHLSALRVAGLSYLIPPATMLQTYLVFGDVITTTDLTGLFLAAAGVYLVLPPRKRGSILARQTNSNIAEADQIGLRQTLRLTQPLARTIHEPSDYRVEN